MLEKLATNLFIAYLIFTIFTYTKMLFNTKNKNDHIAKRKRLEELRNISIKTPDEQKEFINLKYPKTPPFKWTFKNVSRFVGKILLTVAVFIGVRHLWFTYIGFYFQLWHVIIIMIVLPIILNKILKRYNLHQDDILVFFR